MSKERYSEQGLNDLENEINDLQRQLAEEKKDHEISFKCSVDYQNAYEEEKKKLAEAREDVKFVARMIKLTLSHNMSDYEAIMAIDNKLKEKGE